MKTFFSTLCLIIGLTFCFTVTTLANGQEAVPNYEEKMEGNKEQSKQAPSRFNSMTKKFYLISGAIVTAAAANAYYCGSGGCQGIAGAFANSAPTMLGLFVTTTALSYVL